MSLQSRPARVAVPLHSGRSVSERPIDSIALIVSRVMATKEFERGQDDDEKRALSLGAAPNHLSSFLYDFMIELLLPPRQSVSYPRIKTW